MISTTPQKHLFVPRAQIAAEKGFTKASSMIIGGTGNGLLQ